VNNVRYTSIFLLTVLSGLATTIERIPTKQKGAGPLFQIHHGDKWGFMDRRGRIVIRPQFDAVDDFFGGLALVRKEDKSCFIDETGKTVISCNFNAAGNFSKGMAPVRIGRLWGYINRFGKIVVEPQFQGAAEINNGMGRVEIWDRVQCLGKTYTREDAPPHLFTIHDDTFNLTSSCFAEHQRFGFVNVKGEVVVKPEFFVAGDFSEGLAPVRIEDSVSSKFAFIDKTGRIVIPANFDQAYSFSEGLAAVEVAGKWGFIDKSGSVVISPQFDYTGSFFEGLARACDDSGSWGFIDRTGRFTIRPKYISATDFSDGLALVWTDDTTEDEKAPPPSAYIDRDGKTVLTLKGGRWPFSDGLTIAGDYGKRVYINKKGRVVARYEINPPY
jgi:hypothetical protein